MNNDSNNKETIVLVLYPCCTKTPELQSDYYSVRNLKVSNYAIEYRNYTTEELDSFKKDWESAPHLLSSDGYVNKLKNKKDYHANKNFPQNLVDQIKKSIGKTDLIVVDYDVKLLRELKSDGIRFCYVCPSPVLLDEWVGRMFLNDMPSVLIKSRVNTWDVQVLNENKYNSSEVMLYNLSSCEYLETDNENILTSVIHDCMTAGCVNAPKEPDKEEPNVKDDAMDGISYV